MVLEIGSDSGEVLDDGDVESLEQIARPNAAELEDLGCMNPARGQDDLTFGRDGRLSGRSSLLNTSTPSAVDLEIRSFAT